MYKWNDIELFPMYQPIVSFHKPEKIFGYEAVIRGKASNGRIVSPAKLFARAEKDQTLGILDVYARQIAIQEADKLPEHKFLFLNCHGESLKNGRIFEDIANHQVPIDHIVLELTEQTRIDDIHHILDVLKDLRKSGMKIALDDFGAGFSNFWLVESLEPEFIKLDKLLTAHVDHTKRACRVIEGMVLFAEKIKTVLIAEGVERKEQANILGELGIQYGQGFYFGFPFEVSKKRVVSAT
jgi:EAL domain-containing protein (putative c-di-GMP-specific phosphodiesterase class I)